MVVLARHPCPLFPRGRIFGIESWSPPFVKGDDQITESFCVRDFHGISKSIATRWSAIVDWGVAEAMTDTNPFAHTGYKLGSRLLRTDKPLIDALARELTA